MQSHGPFDNYSLETKEYLKKHISKKTKAITMDYFATIREVDRAIEFFFTALKKKKLFDNTLFFIYSDHVSTIFPNKECVDECIPFYIYAKGIIPRKISFLGSQIDISPTLMDLLGWKVKNQWLGDSLLRKSKKGRVVLLKDYEMIVGSQGQGKKQKTLEHFYKYYHYSNYILLRED